MWNPDGASNATVNLSTHSSSSSSAVLSVVRAERQARERQRVLENAATTVQRVYRGRAAAGRVKEQVLTKLEGGSCSVRDGVGALVFILPAGGGERARVGNVLTEWCAAALRKQDGVPAFIAPMATEEGYTTTLAVLLVKILRFISNGPRTTLAASLLTSLEALLSPQAYVTVPPEAQAEIVDTLARQHWVEVGVGILETLIAASQPKKKHPLLQRVVRLLLAPLALSPLTATSPLLAPLINTLLAVPTLPSSIPLQSLTYLSTNLPLFSTLLPAAAANPELLTQGRLADEMGRIYFLANLATFGITGGMLQANGAKGTDTWIRVVGGMLSSLSKGWGRWAEGTEQTPAEAAMAAVEADESDDESKPSKKAPARPPLPPNVGSKLLLLTSTAHLSTLAGFVVNTTDSALLGGFSSFAVGILQAFRGSSRWEATLDAVLDGKRGRALVKLLWREGVRGKWPSSNASDAWDTLSRNPNRHALLLLSHLYCHYLLLTPDDEFFTPATNPLSVDEALDLSLVWRDLAFWAYMHGVSDSAGNSNAMTNIPHGAGSEEERSLFTRGVTRLSERNARRKFAPDEYWVMPTDMQGFIQAVKYEEEELENVGGELAARGPLRHFTRRQIAYLSPRLGLLNNLSMTVPFQTRVEVFREFTKADRERLGISLYNRRTRHSAEIRRSHLAEDGFRQLNRLGSSLKGMVQITFIDKWGNEEAGIDGGGLFKEFLTALSKEAFDTERGLWLANYNNQLYPNPHSYATESHQLQWYSFLGRVLGKALYEDILVDVSFAGFFLAKWLGRQSYLDDLASLDKELYRGLISLKNYPGNPEDLALNFTVTEDDFGVARSVDLVPGGSDIAVTAENKHEYIQLVCKYKLDRQFVEQSRAFFSGLSDIIDPKWLRMFDQQELAQLLGGEEAPIDIADLRKHTNVSGYEDGHTVSLFWHVVEGFNQEQRRALMRFVTSCSRPPLLGFGYLNPGFAIRNSGNDTARLPTASSCANLLKLPDYKDERLLRTKLLQAINSGAGFDMS